jgi:hypothetical protein
MHLAQTEAVKAARAKYGVDYSQLLLSAPAQQNIKPKEVMLEPTELGKLFGCTANGMNKILERVGLQVKTDTGWEPTSVGQGMCMKHHWTKGEKTGYNLKWNVALVEAALNTHH